VKISLVDVEIIDLTEITKNNFLMSKTYSPPLASSKPGGLNKVLTVTSGLASTSYSPPES